MMKHLCSTALFALLFAGAPLAYAGSFSDVSESHPAYDAIEALKEAGILQGYPDGTFQPNKSVNRAEALKIIIAPLLTEDQLAEAKTTVYEDIPEGSWYLPYVEWARQAFKIIDGPPAKTKFFGGNQVILAEYLKMLLLANGVDPLSTYSEIKLPLANDVTDPDEWFYPYIRYGLSASMIQVDEELKLNPGKQLTRADTALLLYHFLLYQQKARTQPLLLQAEGNINMTMKAWEQNLVEQAEYASARALINARGAHFSHPDEPVTRGALKVSESIRALIRGYRAGLNKDYAEAERLAGEGWNLASAAATESPELQPIVEKIQDLAKNMADSSRENQ